MRNAETVLTVIRERGRRGLPLEDIYRQLFNPQLYLCAYARIYQNAGAMTRGTTSETADGMALAKIEKLIDDLRHERYRWMPARRTYIPKGQGKTRPLGIPTWSDKLLQEVIRSLLAAYYEPQFSDHSHGFRPARGCHSALSAIKHTWGGTKWFIEGDIKGCFDRLDHQVLLSILREKLHDHRFLRLIENLLKAGYLECWNYHRTLSGSPQGAIVSPILSNIYLDRLDRFVEQTLIPAYTRGTKRRDHPTYMKLINAKYYCLRQGRVKEARALEKQYQRLPSVDPIDPDYRRLRYLRYADDFLLGFAGTHAEAEEIKERLGEFLRDQLKLELSPEKTLITHATTEAARFLGYEIVCRHADSKHDQRGRRSINGGIGLRVPARVVEERCSLYMKEGKPRHRAERIKDDAFTTINRYQSEYRGVVQYYLLAENVYWFGRLHWVMQLSLLATLAAKYKSSVAKMYRKYAGRVETPDGPRKCLELQVKRDGKPALVARFGGIPLRQDKQAVLRDRIPSIWVERNELIKRLVADECEICGSEVNCEVHHVRKLADLQVEGRRAKPLWKQVMSARRRKTLVVCRACHTAIHQGKPTRQRAAA
ncbi:MAG: maturase [Pyrinomonadaceae bacterium]|nr:maturase [Pyrinomonadaceae bacterium]